jgi:dTDP-4-dehydrorhamnose reductase
VRQAGLDAVVRPTTSDKLVRPAKRPAYSVLSSASLTNYGLSMATWQNALPRYLLERQTSP